MKTDRARAAGRRELTYTVLLCLLGAGLAVFAATRTWSVELTARPAPLPPGRVTRTGGDLLPWLPALALVGLAAAGAVLGTRGIGRRLVGGLLALLGVGVAAGAGYAGFGTGGEVSAGWPLLCVLGGLLAGAAGGFTAVRSGGWPVMGARYERTRPAGAGRESPVLASDGRVHGRRTTAAWDALDRGEDPTVS
ncbi:Trp biosynthesis-associated membrane protein [Plantactinospora sp. KLBMP9567]|uniref:Trp biosynthesis-associated membrane protein n=1 Tax=Plantactinospora sp. KLBMP9567 TaxID=3085900 RepID=UPI002981B73A|nr:Trp biosynthesis-associated membrane protein [Plantactinospora sp. KLBMP9567]MDW5323140.1 Trp biosynthesis-associated membrane protein [Plantactinospora sp. KLBMP9567]